MTKPVVYDCDLHGHTTRSDGNDSPREFIQNAAARGVKIIAITDHDVVPPKTVQDGTQVHEIKEYAAAYGVTFIPGIEISCETNIEDVHLIGFGCKWEDTFFRELDAFTMKSKIRSYKRLVQKLCQYGMPLTWEEILENNGNPIAESAIQKKLIFNKLAEKEYVKDWSAAKLLVKKERSLCVNREKPDAKEVIRRIHEQGGIAIMAHPYLISEQVYYQREYLSRSDFIEELIGAGLDGIEARYTYDKTSYAENRSKAEIYQEIMERYGERLKVISGGSDYHADYKKGVLNPRDMGECGLTEKEFMDTPKLRQLLEL